MVFTGKSNNIYHDLSDFDLRAMVKVSVSERMGALDLPLDLQVSLTLDKS